MIVVGEETGDRVICIEVGEFLHYTRYLHVLLS